MSVYKPAGSQLYVYDFWRQRRRFLGPTGKTSKREAEEVERRRKEQAAIEVAALQVAEAELKGDSPLTLDIAAGKWWLERGQHRQDAEDCWTAIEGMIARFGRTKRMDAFTDAEIATWVATRRGERVWGRTKFKDGREAPLVSATTVNRTTVDALRRIFGHARRKWKLVFANEPDWAEHRLEEPEERVRELGSDEQDALTEIARGDYERVYRFARLSGLRRTACLIRKADVKWSLGRIEVRSKGGKINRVPLSESIRDLLAECWDDHPDFVFTYRAMVTRDKRIKGKRYPITVSGLKTQWKKDRSAAALKVPSIATFRLHDNRHTAATRILRSSKNLKIVQKVLNHARITTTAKYAHVLDEEVLDAMNATPDVDMKSRGKSRGRKTGTA